MLCGCLLEWAYQLLHQAGILAVEKTTGIFSNFGMVQQTLVVECLRKWWGQGQLSKHCNQGGKVRWEINREHKMLPDKQSNKQEGVQGPCKAIKYILPFNSEMYLIACIPRLNIFLIWTIQHISAFYKKKRYPVQDLNSWLLTFPSSFEH